MYYPGNGEGETLVDAGGIVLKRKCTDIFIVPGTSSVSNRHTRKCYREGLCKISYILVYKTIIALNESCRQQETLEDKRNRLTAQFMWVSCQTARRPCFPWWVGWNLCSTEAYIVTRWLLCRYRWHRSLSLWQFSTSLYWLYKPSAWSPIRFSICHASENVYTITCFEGIYF